MSVAKRVIDKCGGEQAVAGMVGVHVSNVHRWRYSKDKGGTGGLVPVQHQQTILDKAREQGIDLRPEDFFEPSQDAAA